MIHDHGDDTPPHEDRRSSLRLFGVLRLGTLVAASLALTGATAARAIDVAVPSRGESRRIDAIKKRGTLRVAVLDEYPWLKRNAARSVRPFQGPAWRLAEEYAKRLGVRLQTAEVAFANKVSILKADRADITVAPLLQTPERERIVDMILYSEAAHCVFGRADNPKVIRAASLDDLDRSDVTIGSIAKSPQGAWLKKRLQGTRPRRSRIAC